LFSGIGGFEYAINEHYKKRATCVGYSEISKPAIEEYERHYPNHKNLGDVTMLKKSDIESLGKIDMCVGGFPCNNLSSANSSNRVGLDGSKSGLFWVMLKLMKWMLVKNPHMKVIIENNASMSHKWRDIITQELSKTFKKHVYCNYFDSSQWVVQRRRRYYWTLVPIPEYTGPRIQSMADILVPLSNASKHLVSDKMINCLNQSPDYLTQKYGHVVSKHNNSYRLERVAYPTRWITRYSTNLDPYITVHQIDRSFRDISQRSSLPVYFCIQMITLPLTQ
jgi:site-specific DNA-cytosine methylase